MTLRPFLDEVISLSFWEHGQARAQGGKAAPWEGAQGPGQILQTSPFHRDGSRKLCFGECQHHWAGRAHLRSGCPIHCSYFVFSLHTLLTYVKTHLL